MLNTYAEAIIRYSDVVAGNRHQLTGSMALGDKTSTEIVTKYLISYTAALANS